MKFVLHTLMMVLLVMLCAKTNGERTLSLGERFAEMEYRMDTAEGKLDKIHTMLKQMQKKGMSA
jgi:hypothetical protein